MPLCPTDQYLMLGMAQEMAKLASVGSVGLHREPPEQLAWYRKMSQLPEEDQAKLAGMMQVLVHGIAKEAGPVSDLLKRVGPAWEGAGPLARALTIGAPAYSAYQLGHGDIGPLQGIAGIVLPPVTLPMAGFLRPAVTEVVGAVGGSFADKGLGWKSKNEDHKDEKKEDKKPENK